MLTLNRKDREAGMGKYTMVAGARVVSGLATVNSKARVVRGETNVHDGKVISLRHFKQEVRSMKKVRKGYIHIYIYIYIYR